jgi:hypothetical protein
VAQIANSLASPMNFNKEVIPKLSSSDGRYPRDFDLPKRVEEFLTMESRFFLLILRVCCAFSKCKRCSFPRAVPCRFVLTDFTLVDSSLDRILIAYNLPRDSGFRRHTGLLLRDFSGIALEAARENKLYTLFEYLGLDLCEQGIGGMRGAGVGLGGLGGSGRLLR